MKREILFGLILGLFLMCIDNAYALTIVDSCQTLSSPDLYVLNQSITENMSVCFTTSTDNIILDCSGYSINMTSADSTVFEFSQSNNITIKNCHIYADNCSNNVVFNNNGNNLVIYNTSVRVCGYAFIFNEDKENITIARNVINGSCSANTNVADLKGRNVNFRDNTVEVYCDSGCGGYINCGDFYFSGINDSVIYDSTFIVYGKHYEPITFHRVYRTIIDNITIDSRNLISADSGMTGRFCCGGDIIFSNSFLYLNETFNVYGVNYPAYNITFDNIHYEGKRPFTLTIHDYDYVTIKNSDFYNTTIEIDGRNLTANPSVTYNFVFNNNDIYDKYIYIHNFNGDCELYDNRYYTDDAIFSIDIEHSEGIQLTNETVSTGQNFGLYVLNSTVTVNDSKFNVSYTGYYGALVRNYGINPPFKSPSKFYNSEFYGNLSGITSDYNGSIEVYNSILDGNTYDVYVKYDGNAELFNTTFDVYQVTTGGRLDVYWLLEVSNPLSATVKIYDYLNSLVSEFSDTDKSIWLREYYVEPDNNRTNTTPHTIQATKSGYEDYSTQLTMNTNRLLTVTLTEIVSIIPTGFTIYWTASNIIIASAIVITMLVMLFGMIEVQVRKPEEIISWFVGFALFSIIALSLLITLISL